METLAELLIGFVVDKPWFAVLILIAGYARIVIKPLWSMIGQIIKHSTNKKDDEWWASVNANKPLEAILYVLDWLLSIKIQPKKE